MVKQIALTAMVFGVMASPPASSFAQGRAQLLPAPCLHGSSEQANQRTRREQALKMAQQINRAERSGPALLPSQPRAYRPFAQLRNVPPAPAGFRLQFYTDGATYTFSLKDTLDRCEFAIFSDQDQGIYQATPRTGVQIVPADEAIP
jgi:hypothetical protein